LKVYASKQGHSELKALLHLKKFDGANTYLIELLDYFEHSGANGPHLCLVLELMWTDVGAFFRAHWQHPDVKMSVVREVSRQVLKALEFLRSCGVIHNGIPLLVIAKIDIRPENFLLTFDPKPMKLNHLLLAEKPNKKPRKGNSCVKDDGNVVI
jgi:serine/threonine-protein kinase SRPK3